MTITVNELMEHSYVISTSREKYEKFCKVFQDAGFQMLPKWFDAVKISNGNRGHSNKLNCSLSHLFLVKMAKQMNLPFICIFEDDSVPHKDIQSLLPYYLSNLNDNIGLLKLGWSKIPPKSKIRKVSDKMDITKSRGGHSYIVFNKNYDNFIRTLENIDLLVDMKAFAY